MCVGYYVLELLLTALQHGTAWRFRYGSRRSLPGASLKNTEKRIAKC